MKKSILEIDGDCFTYEAVLTICENNGEYTIVGYQEEKKPSLFPRGERKANNPKTWADNVANNGKTWVKNLEADWGEING
jgi:hypothetical protein